MAARVLVVIALLALVIWIVAYATGQAELRRERAAPWPYGLGSVDDLAKRPRPKATPDGERILKLLWELPYLGAQNWIAAQVGRNNDAIDPVPAEVEASFGGRESQTAEIVRLVIASEGRIVWPDQRTVRIHVTGAVDTLAVVALEHAAAGNREAAWDHVHAMWILASSLRGQSFAYSRVLAQQSERLTNAVARKLPPPAPSWLEEMTSRDPRPEAAATLQAQSAFAEGSGRRPKPFLAGVAILFRPMIDRVVAQRIRRERVLAGATTERCSTNSSVTPANIPNAEIVARAARIDAEDEATEKLLALKNERARLGRWPPWSAAIAASRCAHNGWRYETDGSSMSLRLNAVPLLQTKVQPALDFRY